MATMVVTLEDATFRQECGDNRLAPGLGCNQFPAWAENDGGIHFFLADFEWGDGGQIWELLPAGDLTLSNSSIVGRLAGSTIEALGNGDVWYSPTSTSCPRMDYRFTFTRR